MNSEDIANTMDAIRLLTEILSSMRAQLISAGFTADAAEELVITQHRSLVGMME